MGISLSSLKAGLFSALNGAFNVVSPQPGHTPVHNKNLSSYYQGMNLDSPVRPNWKIGSSNVLPKTVGGVEIQPTKTDKNIKDWVGYDHVFCPEPGISASESTAGTVTITATRTSVYTDATFQFSYKKDSESSWTNIESASTTTTASKSSLSAGTTYNFKVCQNNGFGTACATTNVTTAESTTQPPEPPEPPEPPTPPTPTYTVNVEYISQGSIQGYNNTIALLVNIDNAADDITIEDGYTHTFSEGTVIKVKSIKYIGTPPPGSTGVFVSPSHNFYFSSCPNPGTWYPTGSSYPITTWNLSQGVSSPVNISIGYLFP